MSLFRENPQSIPSYVLLTPILIGDWDLVCSSVTLLDLPHNTTPPLQINLVPRLVPLELVGMSVDLEIFLKSKTSQSRNNSKLPLQKKTKYKSPHPQKKRTSNIRPSKGKAKQNRI